MEAEASACRPGRGWGWRVPGMASPHGEGQEADRGETSARTWGHERCKSYKEVCGGRFLFLA